MVEMSMNKAIHGAVRRDLRRFLDALGSFPDGDRKRAGQLATAWANFEDQLTHHHEGEHDIAWPALEAVGVTPDVLSQLDDEHETMSDTLAAAGRSIAQLNSTGTAADADAALVAVQTLNDVTVRHFDHEEKEIEPIFLAKRDAPEIKAMGRKFGQVSPARGGRFFAWVTDGATADELAAVKSEVPAPVITVIGGIFGRGYRRNIAPLWKT